MQLAFGPEDRALLARIRTDILGTPERYHAGATLLQQQFNPEALSQRPNSPTSNPADYNPARCAHAAFQWLLKEGGGSFNEARAHAVLLMAVCLWDESADLRSPVLKLFGGWGVSDTGAWTKLGLETTAVELTDPAIAKRWMEVVRAAWEGVDSLRDAMPLAHLQELGHLIQQFRQLTLDWQWQADDVRSPSKWAAPEAPPNAHQEVARLKAELQAKLDDLTVRRTAMRERVLVLLDEAQDLAERQDVNLDSTPLIKFREAWCDKPPGYADSTPEAAEVLVDRLKRRVRQIAANRASSHDVVGTARPHKSGMSANVLSRLSPYVDYAKHFFDLSDVVSPLLDPKSAAALRRPDATPDDVKLRDGVIAAKATAATGRQFREALARLRQTLKEMHEAEAVPSGDRVAEYWGDKDPIRNGQLRRLHAVLQGTLIRPGYVLVHLARCFGLVDDGLLPLLRQIETSPPTLDCITNESIDAEVVRIVDAAAARIGQPTLVVQSGESAKAAAKIQNDAGSTCADARGSTPSAQDDVDEDKPDPETGLSPSRTRARALYEYALARIPGAEKMTRAQLYDAICARVEAEAANAHGRHAEEVAKLRECLPPNAEAFGKYLRDAGIKAYDKGGNRKAGRSIRRQSEV